MGRSMTRLSRVIVLVSFALGIMIGCHRETESGKQVVGLLLQKSPGEIAFSNGLLDAIDRGTRLRSGG